MMKTDLKATLKTAKAALQSLKDDAGQPDFTPQLGAALGGLRTAVDGLEAHLEKTKPVDEKPAVKLANQ